MNKKGLSWAKIIGLIIAVVVLVMLILFSQKIIVLKDLFTNLFGGLGG